MNSLKEIFISHQGNMIYKWHHYFSIYENHFNRLRNLNETIVIVEIGVLNGGSLQLWKKYFGPKAVIYGIDIHSDCLKYEEDQINIRIGSSADKLFLNKLKSEIPQIDILIDDGSHRMNHQIVAFNNLWDSVSDKGLYLVEDTHTSYWNEFGGGIRRSGTFINFTHHLIDSMHAWYSEQSRFKIDKFSKTISSIHYYDSIVVFEKCCIKEKPFTIKSGIDTTTNNRNTRNHNLKTTIIYRSAYKLLIKVNKILQFLNIRGIIVNG